MDWLTAQRETSHESRAVSDHDGMTRRWPAEPGRGRVCAQTAIKRPLSVLDEVRRIPVIKASAASTVPVVQSRYSADLLSWMRAQMSRSALGSGLAGGWRRRSWRSPAAPMKSIAAQLLVTEPALMLFPALKPGPGYYAADTHQGTDQHGQEVRHALKVATSPLRMMWSSCLYAGEPIYLAVRE